MHDEDRRDDIAQPTPAGYEPPAAEDLDVSEGPSVTAAGVTPPA